MSDYRDTINFEVEYAAHSVALAVDHIVRLSQSHPNLVRLELDSLATSNDRLAELVAKLTVRDAAE